LPFVEAVSVENFQEWVADLLPDIRAKRYIVIKTSRNEFFVYPRVTTGGLLKPYTPPLTDEESKKLEEWFEKRGIKIKKCANFYIDDRKDPRELKKD